MSFWKAKPWNEQTPIEKTLMIFGAGVIVLGVMARGGGSHEQQQPQQSQQAKAEAPTDCADLRSGIRQREAQLAYVRNAMAADSTLAMEPKLQSQLQISELALVNAKAYYGKHCTMR